VRRNSPREFVRAALALVAISLLCGCEMPGQRAPKVPRIGFLAVGSREGRDLVGLSVDVIVARSTRAVQAAKKATNTIPIVMAASGLDPVELGLVAGLARRAATSPG